MSSFDVLLGYMQTLKYTNLEIVVKYRHHQTRVLEETWNLDPYFRHLQRVQHCHPMISVDVTHLKGICKGVLLVASS